MNKESQNINTDIDLVGIVRICWTNRKDIFKSILAMLILGILIAFGSKTEYQSYCQFLPNQSTSALSNLGSIGSIAGLAGINLDIGSNEIISPDMYPQVIQSLPFQLKIINEKLSFEKEDTLISAYKYFKCLYKPSLIEITKKYTIGMPDLIKSFFSNNMLNEVKANINDSIINISKEDSKLIDDFEDRLSISVDSNTGIITLTTEMPDPLASAELTNKCVRLLQKMIIEYQINKAVENLAFINERYIEAKENLETSQKNLAIFSDKNQNVISAQAQIEQQRLKDEYNLAFSTYQALANQLVQAKIKVKQDTPVFTIVQPVQLPVDKSSPKRIIILVISMIFGVFLGVVLILVKNRIVGF